MSGVASIGLPEIPVIDARVDGHRAVLRAADAQLRDLFRTARRTFTPPALALLDRLSRHWLARNANPYLGEIDDVAALLGRAGAYTLNASYEWTCTCGVGDDGQGGVHLLRVLDWGQQGLGRNVVVVRQQGRAGDFVSITWPGYAGIITAIAPGRFAAAINQPPIRSWNSVSPLATLPLDWMRERISVWRSHALPPPHLLRRAFENCATYADAKRALTETPICLPAFFTLAGIRPGEGCVIERTPAAAATREMPAAVGNHWVSLPERGRPRGHHSRERQLQMQMALVSNMPSWQSEPIVNRDTRVVAELNPGTGHLAVQGWEPDGPATMALALVL